MRRAADAESAVPSFTVGANFFLPVAGNDFTPGWGASFGMTETVEIPTLLPAVPEIVLAVGAMLLLMVGVFRGEQASKGIETGAILLLLVTALIVGWLPAGKLVTFGGSFVVDGFARFLKLLALAGSAAAIVMSSNYLAVEKRVTFEYSILILLSTVGMMISGLN